MRDSKHLGPIIYLMAVAAGSDGAMRRDVIFARLIEAVAADTLIEIIDSTGFRGLEDGGEFGSMRLAHGFTVPAGTFAVDFSKHPLVVFRGAGEGVRELRLWDLVIVVDESCFCFAIAICVVVHGTELVGVPDKVDREGRYECLIWPFAHHGEELIVSLDKARHGVGTCW